jgi:tetratricopeptide (TPR) repeat protein
LDALPDKSPLLGRAEQLLADGGSPDRAVSLATQALRDDEWRLYRIRFFDWFSPELKRDALPEMQNEYLRAWAVQVRAFRKLSRLDSAAGLLSQVERAVAGMSKGPDSSYWDGLYILANLYLEGKQADRAAQTLDQMQQLLGAHPNDDRASTLSRLRQMVASIQK